ncbi:MAG: hypothetical protein IIA45_06170, partial [Bacteroidetes bacterium]|nr:hypothetical protein [Bacteroidota bacterium]
MKVQLTTNTMFEFKKIFFTVIILLSVALVFNANAQIKFQKTFGGDTLDTGYSIAKTHDDGFIIAGSTLSFGAGNSDIYLLKIDKNGAYQLSKTVGSGGYEFGFSVQQTYDSGYVIVGYTNSFGAGNLDVCLLKTDITGKLKWSKTYGGTGTDFGYSVEETSDSGFIIGGYTKSFGAGNNDVYLLKTNRFGTLEWSKTYGDTGDEKAFCVKQNIDGGYL